MTVHDLQAVLFEINRLIDEYTKTLEHKRKSDLFFPREKKRSDIEIPEIDALIILNDHELNIRTQVYYLLKEYIDGEREIDIQTETNNILYSTPPKTIPKPRKERKKKLSGFQQKKKKQEREQESHHKKYENVLHFSWNSYQHANRGRQVGPDEWREYKRKNIQMQT